MHGQLLIRILIGQILLVAFLFYEVLIISYYLVYHTKLFLKSEAKIAP